MGSGEAVRSLGGRRALICGGTRGIGRACATEFARRGAQITLLARDEGALRRVRDELPGVPGSDGRVLGHDYLRADFNDPEAVRRAVTRHLASVRVIHILLNNTGGPAGGPLLDAEPEALRSAFSSHLICSQILAQALVPGMRGAGYGRIINIVSTSVKQPLKGLGVSNTVRAAVAGWAKTLSVELAPFGITVNNLLPGATLTDRLREIIREKARTSGRAEAEVEEGMKAEIPAGRFGTPEEIAAAAGFLASPEAGYVTGISLPVDGGRTLSLS